MHEPDSVVRRRWRVVLLTGLFLAAGLGPARTACAQGQAPTAGATQSEDKAAGDKPSDDDEKKPDGEEKPKDSVTKHTVTIAGREIAYTATAGTITLATEEGKEKADVFYIAYTMDGEHDPAERPITFAFNGGPGSSSVWLHLGVFGPRRVVMDEFGNAPPPSGYALKDNDLSILDVTDLVFIDPVSTGFSRAKPGEDAAQYHGVNEDVESVGEFVRLYCTRNARWASPKFLAGESYGTTRASALVNHLQDRHGMFFCGVVLISCAMDFSTLRFDTGNDLPYVLFLPTYTATAWHHGKLARELQQDLAAALREADSFSSAASSDACCSRTWRRRCGKRRRSRRGRMHRRCSAAMHCRKRNGARSRKRWRA